jgi:hypothetical protein
MLTIAEPGTGLCSGIVRNAVVYSTKCNQQACTALSVLAFWLQY